MPRVGALLLLALAPGSEALVLQPSVVGRPAAVGTRAPAVLAKLGKKEAAEAEAAAKAEQERLLADILAATSSDKKNEPAKPEPKSKAEKPKPEPKQERPKAEKKERPVRARKEAPEPPSPPLPPPSPPSPPPPLSKKEAQRLAAEQAAAEQKAKAKAQREAAKASRQESAKVAAASAPKIAVPSVSVPSVSVPTIPKPSAAPPSTGSGIGPEAGLIAGLAVGLVPAGALISLRSFLMRGKKLR